MVELSTVNRSVVGSSPTLGAFHSQFPGTIPDFMLYISII